MESGKDKLPLPVTDHAVVRYLERVAGVDIAAIRAHLQPTPRARERVEELQELKVKKRDCTLVIVSGHVVTVLRRR